MRKDFRIRALLTLCGLDRGESELMFFNGQEKKKKSNTPYFLTGKQKGDGIMMLYN